MGCFNMTCSVSRLPITDGMPIRAFVLARPEKAPEYSFDTTSFYIPLTPGITGKYDDYGRIEKCTVSESFKTMADFFFPQLKGSYEPLFDSNVDKATTAQGLKGYSISLAFVREDVYQEICKISKKPLLRENIEADLKDLKENIEKLENDGLSKYLPKERITAFAAMEMSSRFRSAFAAEVFVGGEMNALYQVLQPCRDKLLDTLFKGKIDDTTIDFAMEMSEHLRFNGLLQQLAITWQPTTHMLGQQTPYDLQRAFNKAMHGICVQEAKEQLASERGIRPPRTRRSGTKGNAPQ